MWADDFRNVSLKQHFLIWASGTNSIINHFFEWFMSDDSKFCLFKRILPKTTIFVLVFAIFDYIFIEEGCLPVWLFFLVHTLCSFIICPLLLISFPVSFCSSESACFSGPVSSLSRLCVGQMVRCEVTSAQCVSHKTHVLALTRRLITHYSKWTDQHTLCPQSQCVPLTTAFTNKCDSRIILFMQQFTAYTARKQQPTNQKYFVIYL